ncbi:IclR family transcriptional regulator [Mesorhizobium sp. LHD-90]|uniref:IclR family transcriptional regulator n=1 Tax=Mesorhizobium sp. LHD-90 TaxID=3071414 RepID=UPI0027E12C0E|nr:IclR family transcriptional regulator [Mesorhizobium sp. LHD-90]MDQ6437491.1 IclR family transcriptional regulator [Mesorhizobium sp. LHD-90]
MVSTVAKAVSLLETLGADISELGLAELAGRVGFDKTTTRRLLISLIECGLVEQDERSRCYRLGAGISRLALLREAQFPFLRTATPTVERLAQETGETVHLSEYSSRGLVSVHVVESTKANRVSVPVGMILPLHATASGIALLAFARKKLRDAVAEGPFPAFTRHTVSAPEELSKLIEAARARGYSTSTQGFEEGVFSVAAPILGVDGIAIGALAIATPQVRIRKGDIERHGAAVAAGASEIGEHLFGLLPSSAHAAAQPQRARARI